MPRPPVAGAHLLAFPAMAATLAVFVLMFAGTWNKIHRDILRVLLFVTAFAGWTAVSFYLNAPDLRGTALAELIRPVLFGTFLLFGYFAALSFGEPSVRRGLVLAAQTILVGQLIIATTQFVGLPVFDLLYATEKTRAFGGILRMTGSMTNPNIFAWIVAQASVIAFYYASRRRWLWLALGSLLVLIAGSRTLLLVFPFIVIAVGIWRRKGGWTAYVRGAAMGTVALVAALLLVFLMAQHLPYLAELRNVLGSGSLESVNAFAKRVVRWERTYWEFAEGGPWAWSAGLGSRETTRVLDNDYLYVLFRLGGVGLVIHCMFIGYVALLFRRSTNTVASVVGMEYLTFSLILGLVYETLGGWLFPLLLLFLLGLSIGLTNRAPGTARLHVPRAVPPLRSERECDGISAANPA